MITEKHPDYPAASAELPRYRCHKEVWALKIKDIVEQPAGECRYSYQGNTGAAICGYPPWERMHEGSSDPIIPPLGRHIFVGPSQPCALIIPEDERYAPFGVDREYVQKHTPKAGGY